ncbi:GDSL esterase/lipase At4g10955-like isoform X1 [Cryptomeria japonica]|uniref:GDSL esterase/lipase At4g10955 isoform X1 n=1 Tax=Cryptomeria japonica TaxID=3369 RepID=UPI0027D9FA47|nr:GDSL esterase/lipase At4g10955 isoform X1 [Cryptomeria japonica]XP_059071085.1 GDSL esterase/lipase At4g10955-like isoform X1 [Cryptomeria japonica]XP_059071087.1 GDSL esterase/lipase At4g10955-like isoform X1 [Cryptomeria japonica]XP_059071581.1 GDSL esterase/lipase At4g10955-like isoform X1 [Cryptomeria japonica]
MANNNGIDVTELLHLALPNWEDPIHRRCIAAGLVNIVYVLETNPNQAKELCCLLQFEVKETAIDEHDKSVYGAVFEWRGKEKAGPGGPPSEVVAFRGTLLRPRNILEDLILDFKVAIAHFNSIERIDKGLPFLRNSLHRNGCQNIWITGHSLGAAIALAAARKLEQKERRELEAHLFNPPFLSPTFPQLKVFERIAKILVGTRKCAPSFQCSQSQEICKHIQGPSEALAFQMGLKDESKLLELYGDFLRYSDWIPNLYVNEKDLICATYLHYFEVWKGIYEQKSHLVHESMKYFFCFEVATKKTPWHIVPSAKVFRVGRHFFSNHHGICQWWSKNLQVKSIEYIPPDEVTHCNFNRLQKSVVLHNKDGDDANHSSY